MRIALLIWWIFLLLNATAVLLPFFPKNYVRLNSGLRHLSEIELVRKVEQSLPIGSSRPEVLEYIAGNFYKKPKEGYSGAPNVYALLVQLSSDGTMYGSRTLHFKMDTSENCDKLVNITACGFNDYD